MVLVPELPIVHGYTTGRDRGDPTGPWYRISAGSSLPRADRRYAWGSMSALDEVLGAIRWLPLSERLSGNVDSSAERDAVVRAALASAGVSALDDRLRGL